MRLSPFRSQISNLLRELLEVQSVTSTIPRFDEAFGEDDDMESLMALSETTVGDSERDE